MSQRDDIGLKKTLGEFSWHLGLRDRKFKERGELLDIHDALDKQIQALAESQPMRPTRS
jgi:hypothetical protein